MPLEFESRRKVILPTIHVLWNLSIKLLTLECLDYQANVTSSYESVSKEFTSVDPREFSFMVNEFREISLK